MGSLAAGFGLTSLILHGETHQQMNVADRAHLDTFLTAIDASPTALERPNCRGWVGEYQITGKHGHVLADGAGYFLYATTPERDRRDPDGKIRTYGSSRRWNNVKRQLIFARLIRDGDDEGVLRLDRLPTEAEAGAIRDCLGIRRRRHLSPEALAQARSALELAAGRAKSPVPEPGSAQVVGPMARPLLGTEPRATRPRASNALAGNCGPGAGRLKPDPPIAPVPEMENLHGTRPLSSAKKF
jgi:hypothetical protein